MPRNYELCAPVATPARHVETFATPPRAYRLPFAGAVIRDRHQRAGTLIIRSGTMEMETLQELYVEEIKDLWSAEK